MDDDSSIQFETFLDLPDARYMITEGLKGIVQLQAMRIDAITKDDIGDFQFKLMFSPNRSIARLELYDPNMFPILLEQLLSNNYSIISTGEDVEFTHGNKGGWFGWAHFEKRNS